MHPLLWLFVLGIAVFALYSIITQTFNALAFVFIIFFAFLFYGMHVRLSDPNRPEDAYERLVKVVRPTLREKPVIPGLTGTELARKYGV